MKKRKHLLFINSTIFFINKAIVKFNNAIFRFKTATAELKDNLSNFKVNLLRQVLRQGCTLMQNRNGFGMNEVLGIALAIIVAAFVIIPGLQEFAEDVISRLVTWWASTATKVFVNGNN
ncbi:MAG TPA: hypothetical protein GXX37_05965 [Clostridiaceae bacterium]|nr:hypothetical protein [Clostridiaceae bacterium]